MAGLGLPWSAILRRGDVWVYPKSADVMAAAGLRPIRESILRRRRTVLAAIEGRKLLAECREAERQPGSPARRYWWEQEFELDEDEGDAGDPVGRGPGATRVGVAGHDVLRRRQRRELDEELQGEPF